MKNILSKEEVKANFGELSFFKKTGKEILVNKLKYLHGIKPFDEIIKKEKLISNYIYLDRRPKGLLIILQKGFSTLTVGLEFNEIEKISIEPQEIFFQEKSKSVIGRALIGGVLLGPVGAIAGGLSGLGNKKVKVDDTPELIISIICQDNSAYVFSAKNKDLKEITTYFNNHFKDILSITERTNVDNQQKTSVVDELIKLNSLLDSGVITIEDFNKLKEKIINNE